jgi:TRAP-type C4-dicarboxylate transport system permease small subunit
MRFADYVQKKKVDDVMKKFLDIYLKSMDIIDVIVRKMLIILAGLMTLAVILQVLCRYVLKYPLVWTEEAARYLMIWMVFIGASCTIKKWDNIYVDFFIKLLKKKNQRIMIMFQKFMVLGLLIYSFYICMIVLPKLGVYQKMTTINLSMFWVESSMIVGFFLAILQNIGVILNDLFKRNILSEEVARC